MAIQDMKAAIAKGACAHSSSPLFLISSRVQLCGPESWETKGKFPPSLKPVLAQVALKAIRLNEYDDNFFNLMPRLFPYNRFTMSVRF